MPIMAIDQGTTSTRAIIFNDDGMPLASDQIEHEQIFPRAGWVEHDPMEIWHNTREVMGAAIAKSNLFVSDLQAVGITQQRETTVVWNKTTGLPVYNAIVWQDTRTQEICDELAQTVGEQRFREITGLPLATYFSGPKVRWILDNVPGTRAQADRKSTRLNPSHVRQSRMPSSA